MLILTYIPSYKHISCQIFFLWAKEKNHGVSPTPPSTENIPNFDSYFFFFFFCEKMRYRVSVDYIKPFGNLRSVAHKSCLGKITGIFGRRGLKRVEQFQ